MHLALAPEGQSLILNTRIASHRLTYSDLHCLFVKLRKSQFLLPCTPWAPGTNFLFPFKQAYTFAEPANLATAQQGGISSGRLSCCVHAPAIGLRWDHALELFGRFLIDLDYSITVSRKLTCRDSLAVIQCYVSSISLTGFSPGEVKI